MTDEGRPNFEYLDLNYSAHVCVAQCEKKIYNVQEKLDMTLSAFLEYWKNHDSSGKCLYMKDWHFTKDFPEENVYIVPKFFASDWLGEFYDFRKDLQDDYRFVYMGPNKSWWVLFCFVEIWVF